MAAKKPPYSAKVKCWLPTFTTEMDGGMQGCAVEIFYMLPLEQQAEALEKMQSHHAIKLIRHQEKQAQV
ncbi:hypothetical protein [Candidatus Pantoea multigeneris]|uniref:Uncharacterized protein n=1 Tax=Candidatus Pantoea multigeneris TaxID=2608357 RepID=A0ABX0R9D3_9GAMM|nr:hypothetical protein [Pantoea multigeneris]NIF20289.1 hypothetical protein [Pantoea multigeneris]